MKVVWTKKAKSQIREIYTFYSNRVSAKLAMRIISEILQKPKILLKQPNLGQKEQLLEVLNLALRYLIQGNYKLIYLATDQEVVIVSVFDTRQNPSKLTDM